MENMSPRAKRRRVVSELKMTKYLQEKKCSRRRKEVLKECPKKNNAVGDDRGEESSRNKEEKDKPPAFVSKELTNLGYIDAGGFGKVFKVKTTEGQVLALKCMEMDGNGKEVPEFLECKLQRSISHENIVKALKSIQESPKRRCILMEYCSQGNLYNYMCSKGFPVNNRRSKKYVVNIIDGLVHLQTEFGYIHMDLKPENVLVSSGDVAKITDFGCVVKMTGFRNLMKEHNGGTTTYQPPEMLRKEGYDSTVDVWGLGCITYELFVGKHPFFPEIVRSSFQCSQDCVEAGLEKMDEACSGKLFVNCSKIVALRIQAFVNSILGRTRERRPLSTELRNSAWLK